MQRERAATAGPWRPSVTLPRARRHDQASARTNSAAPQAAAPRAPRNGYRPQRGSDRADDHTQRARAAEKYVPCRESKPLPRRRSGRASRRHSWRHDQASAKSASAAAQAAAPRAPRDDYHPQRGSDRADDHMVRARAAEHYALCHKSEAPPRGRGGRTPRCSERGGTTKPATDAPARRRRQRRRERRVTATIPKRKRPRQRVHAENASRRALRIVPRERSAAAGPQRPSVTPPRSRRYDLTSARCASAAPQAAAPRAPRDGTPPREEATVPTTARRERELPRTTHFVERASRRHGGAAAERHPAERAAERPS